MSVSHLDLAAVSRAMREAASDEDLPRLADLLQRFRSDLLDHVRDEATDDVIDLRSGALHVARDGQQRLLDLVESLVDAVTDGDVGGCRLRATELDARLRRQVRLEATLALDHLFAPSSADAADG